jgi:hypothetical protein
LFVCSFGVFVCGGPVRDGRTRAGTSPARSEGPLGVLWVLTHGARRASTGWLRAHSGTQSTRTVHAGSPARARAPVPHPPRHAGAHAPHTTHVNTRTHTAPAPTHAQVYSRIRTHTHTHAHVHTRMQRPADASGAFLLGNDPLAGITGQCCTRPECPFSPLDRARFGADLAAWAEPCDPAPVEGTQTRATAWWKPEPSSQQVACVCVCVFVRGLNARRSDRPCTGWRRRRSGPRDPQARAFLADSGLLGVLCEYVVCAS